MKNLVGILVLGVGLTAGLFGQTASLAGTVSDPSGAVIPSAVVTVVNTETGLQREDKSDSQGRYTMEPCRPARTSSQPRPRRRYGAKSTMCVYTSACVPGRGGLREGGVYFHNGGGGGLCGAAQYA
jgi:hypothetical protein